MAIGALYGEDHNFMHDLESFFWVLFWLCIHSTGSGGNRRTEFDSWNFKNTEELACEKAGLVIEEDKFSKKVDENFTAYYKPLIPCVQELRKVVFPEGKRWLRDDCTPRWWYRECTIHEMHVNWPWPVQSSIISYMRTVQYPSMSALVFNRDASLWMIFSWNFLVKKR